MIGLAGQNAAVDENLTGLENLEMVGRLYHVPAAEAKRRGEEILERFELSDAAHRVAKTYSGGMRRRLDLGASLVGRPQVLFLDEPTTGLDPRGRLEMWDVIRDLVTEGTTLLLTTQYLDEADRLADSIAVIDGGRVIAEGTSDELKARVGGEVLALRVADRSRAPDAAGAVLGLGPGGGNVDNNTGEINVPVGTEGTAILTEAVRRLDDQGIQLADVGPASTHARRRLPGPHRARRRGGGRGAAVRRRRQVQAPRSQARAGEGMSAITETLHTPGRLREHGLGLVGHHPAEPHHVRAEAGPAGVLDDPAGDVRAAVRLRVRGRVRDDPPGQPVVRRLPDGRDLRADGDLRRDADGRRTRRRPSEGHHRSVPVAADGSLGGPGRSNCRRHGLGGYPDGADAGRRVPGRVIGSTRACGRRCSRSA